jgi:hypothetical protein
LIDTSREEMQNAPDDGLPAGCQTSKNGSQPPNPTQTAVISKRDGISLKFCSHRWNSTSFLLIKELLQIEILHISDVLNLVASAFYF